MSVFSRAHRCGIGVPEGRRRHAARREGAGNAFIPPVSIVPMRQTGPTPSECAVHPGEAIREGMVIGRSRGMESVEIHSPIPGTVSHIKTIILPDGAESQAVVIRLGGSFDLLSSHKLGLPWHGMRPADICSLAADKGIYPCYAEDPSPRDWHAIASKRGIEKLIVRCFEKEPYLANCGSAVAARPEAFAEGLRIAQRVLDPAETVIAGPRDPARQRELEAALGGAERASFRWFREAYPLSEGRQLAKAVTGRELGGGGDFARAAAEAGIMLTDAETLVTLSDCVSLGKPCIERFVTIAGDAIKRPTVLKARIGTPIGDLIEECGGFAGKPHKIVMGGPMTGRCVDDLDSPVLKSTDAVLALSWQECHDARSAECVRCGACLDACPAGLDPSTMLKQLRAGHEAEAIALGIDDCTQCGCCAYACPSRIPLVEGFAGFRAGRVAR